MEIIIISVLVLNTILVAFLIMKSKSSESTDVSSVIKEGIKSELKENREELSNALKSNREELSDGMDKLTKKLEEKLVLINEGLAKSGKDNREELGKSLKEFSESFADNVKQFNELQKQKFDTMSEKQDELVKSTELKLEKMRETVDEKLHKTLEERLGQSFKIVSERLEAVQKGLGEMQNLASGVGDLKKVLSNVKTRGVLGEIRLGNILEQIMAPEQYEANVKTKSGSNDHVEFAIKLPGRSNDGTTVYLPIDAKFPQEDFVRLQAAYDAGNVEDIEKLTKALANSIKRFAKEIHGKYIDPPNTTDFGIMFLPIEGLFAEVVRQPDLIAKLQRDYKIIVTGPTTLAAMLNSLQMGFKTLAIQKRSSEVWDILGAVKTEFGKFGGVLEKAQKKINEANKELDTLVGTRTRIMMSKLKKVEELPSSDKAENLIDEVIDPNPESDED
jgi:DNA recombination protein RmuC